MFAFQVLPIIIFFASLTSVLHYLGVLQFVVNLLAGDFRRPWVPAAPSRSL